MLIVEKEGPRAASVLCARLEDLLSRNDPALQRVWSAQLTKDQHQLLQAPTVAHDLLSFASRTWPEWAVIGGKSFGILGITPSGAFSWLQLAATSRLSELAKEAEADGTLASDVRDVRFGRSLVAAQFGTARDRGRGTVTIPAFYIGDLGTLLGALQRVEYSPGSPYPNCAVRQIQ